MLICSHYDTRPRADQERDRDNWDKPFISANDGTSGVAWLMELGHHVKQMPLTIGLDFILFDGEEYVFDGGGPGSRDTSCINILPSGIKLAPWTQVPGGHPPRPVRREKTKYKVEMNSWSAAPGLVKAVWDLAAEMQVRSFVFEQGPQVSDDHLALHRVGIPTVDIIDFDYPYWHKLGDRPDECSAGAMENVAKVLNAWLQPPLNPIPSMPWIPLPHSLPGCSCWSPWASLVISAASRCGHCAGLSVPGGLRPKTIGTFARQAWRHWPAVRYWSRSRQC